MTTLSKQKAFTLLELIIVIVIVGIISIIASKMLAQGFNGYLTAINVTEADWQARLSLERMVRDIRSIRSSTDISTASASQLSFVDSDGNSVSYALSGTNLTRNGQILATGISSLSFSYYNSSGAVTSTLSAIRYISITLNITEGNANYSVSTSAYPRNL